MASHCDSSSQRLPRHAEHLPLAARAVRVSTPVGLKLAPGRVETISISRSTSIRASRRSRMISSLPLLEIDCTRSDSASRLSAATSISVETASGGGPKRSVSSARISLSDVLGGGDLAVDLHAQVRVLHVLLRDRHRHRQVDRDRGRLLDRLAAQLAHGLFEELQIGLDAHRGDVAALLAAQEVAGAADLQVAGGDAEAGAEVGELADGRQALARRLGEDAVLRHQQVAVGELVAPPHPAAELVELRQAEAVGAVDDHGVDVGDVDAVLDDRRGEQDVELAGSRRRACGGRAPPRRAGRGRR